MQRVKWNGQPLEAEIEKAPQNIIETIFDHLPPQIPITPAIEDLSFKYFNGQFLGEDYAAVQAAAFLMPKSKEVHSERRETFRSLVEEAISKGFEIPATFQRLVETDAYIDRLHHNTIWLQLPDELCRLPNDPAQLVFLAFAEGQGCRYWHLLLSPDGTHCMISCEHPFGLLSNWTGDVPDTSNWNVKKCADSLEEWLYFYFQESAEHDRKYLERLKA